MRASPRAVPRWVIATLALLLVFAESALATDYLTGLTASPDDDAPTLTDIQARTPVWLGTQATAYLLPPDPDLPGEASTQIWLYHLPDKTRQQLFPLP